MKIAIDASRLTKKDRTGTENYLYYLLRTISKKDLKNDYILYFSEDPDPNLLIEVTSGNDNFTYKTLKKKGSWTQISLAIELWKNTPDLFFTSWHTMPGINKFWKMKTVATVHDLTGRLIPTFWTVHFASKVIAVTNYVKQNLVKRFRVPKEKIEVVYEGYDLMNFERKSDAEIKKAKKKYDINGDYIFFLSSIGPRKNVENMVKAFNTLDTNHEFILGGGVMPGSENLLDLPAGRHGLPAKFIGRVEQSDLPALYSGATFFILASKEEGFGIPILDSMVCGTPVITSNNSATKEIGDSAVYFVDPNSVESIAKGMKEMLSNKNLRERLATKGSEHYKKFSWSKAAEETLKVFERTKNEK